MLKFILILFILHIQKSFHNFKTCTQTQAEQTFILYHTYLMFHHFTPKNSKLSNKLDDLHRGKTNLDHTLVLSVNNYFIDKIYKTISEINFQHYLFSLSPVHILIKRKNQNVLQQSLFSETESLDITNQYST